MEKYNLSGDELENAEELIEDIEGENPYETKWEEDLKPIQKSVPYVSIGKKWYMVGIGGAGCNIVDAIGMRIHQIEDRKDMFKIWKCGLVEDYVMLDTNISGLLNTYTAKKKEWDASGILSNCIIAANIEHGNTGVGYNWAKAKKWMEEEEITKKSIESKINRDAIKRAQGVMVLHSVTKGTGCGASPVFVDYLRAEVLKGTDRPIFSVTILPSSTELYAGLPSINGIIGLSRIAKASDGVILFDNSSLDRNKNNGIVNIENIENYNGEYGNLNNPLVAFLEGFVITRGIFDIKDSFEPAKLKLGQNKPLGIICAPVHGKHMGNDFGSSQEEKEGNLENLLISTIIQGRLVTCNPKTAIGGSFVFHVPDESAKKQIQEIINNGTFHKVIQEKKFLNDPEGNNKIIFVYPPIIIPSDNIYLWGILWNPEIETLKTMYNYTKAHKDIYPETTEIWDTVETLFKNLGGKT